MAIEPLRDRGEGRVAEVLFKQPPDSWDVREITGLSVALPQPREYPQDLAIALHGENGGGAKKGRAVERREGSEIALGEYSAQLGGNIAPSVLEEGYEIVAGGTADRVLEIEKPAAPHP